MCPDGDGRAVVGKRVGRFLVSRFGCIGSRVAGSNVTWSAAELCRISFGGRRQRRRRSPFTFDGHVVARASGQLLRWLGISGPPRFGFVQLCPSTESLLHRSQTKSWLRTKPKAQRGSESGNGERSEENVTKSNEKKKKKGRTDAYPGSAVDRCWSSGHEVKEGKSSDNSAGDVIRQLVVPSD